MEKRFDRTVRMVEANCALTDEEILDALLADISPLHSSERIAAELIDRFGSLAGTMDQPFCVLSGIEGVGEKGALRILLLRQVPRAIEQQNVSQNRRRISTVAEMFEYIKPFYLNEHREVLYILLLNSKMRVIELRKISEGDNEGVVFDPKTVVAEVLKYGAQYIILYHNHFISRLPSDRDVVITDKIDSTLTALGITLFDHLIICENSALSMRQDGYFKNPIATNMKDGY